MKKKTISIPSVILGCTEHYDSKTGQLVGYSTEGLVLGTKEHFCNDGSSKGFRIDSIFGDRTV